MVTPDAGGASTEPDLIAEESRFIVRLRKAPKIVGHP